MIGCEEALRRLWEYLDGTAGTADHRLVEEHLARCLQCCGERDFALELRRLLSCCGPEEMPEDVRHRLHDTLEGLTDE